MKKGRILALDYGTKRIGLAVTDPDRTIVFPREVLMNRGENFVVSDVVQYCKKNAVTLVLVGVPFNDDHSETAMTSVIRYFIQNLKNALAQETGEPVIEVLEQDEKFTTAEARAILEELGMDPVQQRQHKDILSAMIILQGYLNRN